jgi:hypothetical protein
LYLEQDKLKNEVNCIFLNLMDGIIVGAQIDGFAGLYSFSKVVTILSQPIMAFPSVCVLGLLS